MEHGEAAPERHLEIGDTAGQDAAMREAHISEHETEHDELIGEDSGAKRVLCHMILDPRLPMHRVKMKGLTDDQIREQFREALEKHCMTIGWWPDGEGPDFVVAKREDGIWHGWAKLRESSHNRSKAWEDFPRVMLDQRTSADILVNRSSTAITKKKK